MYLETIISFLKRSNLKCSAGSRLYKNITQNLMTVLVTNILRVALKSLFIFRNTKWSSHTPFYGWRGSKRKRSTDVNFLEIQRWSFFFFKLLSFKQNLNRHLYKAEPLWTIDLVAFVFYSTGMERWWKKMCFLLQERKKWGGRCSYFRQDGEN